MPGRVLEAGDHVQELHAAAGRHLRAVLRAQVVEVEALRPEADADHPRLGGAEGGGRADVGRPLDEDDVAGIEEHARDEVQPLLAALGDQHLARRWPASPWPPRSPAPRPGGARSRA